MENVKKDPKMFGGYVKKVTNGKLPLQIEFEAEVVQYVLISVCFLDTTI